jgi:hypothetical protein
MRGTAVWRGLRRALGTLPLAAALTVTAIACASGSTAAATETGARTPGTRIRIIAGKTVLTAHLWDNATARSLIAQLPLKLSFRDFNGQEKVAHIPRPLSMRGMPKSADPRPGEIGYYAPTQELVLYYTDVGRFDGIARIGRFDGSIAAIKSRKSDFVARIELAH